MLFVVLNDEFQNRNEPDEFLISLAVLCINCLLLLLEEFNGFSQIPVQFFG